MKIELNYDAVTGQITDNIGTILLTWMGLENHQTKSGDVEMLVKLKNAGFETDDIVELHRKELI